MLFEGDRDTLKATIHCTIAIQLFQRVAVLCKIIITLQMLESGKYAADLWGVVTGCKEDVNVAMVAARTFAEFYSSEENHKA